MHNNKIIFAVLCIFALGFIFIGGTFAYLSWQTSEEQKTNVVFSVGSGFQCAVDGGGDLNSSQVVLIPANCTDSNYAIKREIVVTPALFYDDLTISMDLWLDINMISTGLSNSGNFKYALTTSSTSCTQGVISSGNFNGKVAGNTVSLISSKQYSSTVSETYYLYIWLDSAETSIQTTSQSFDFMLNGSCADVG